MPSSHRPRRPALQRTLPRRAWRGLYVPTDGARCAPEPEPSAASAPLTAAEEPPLQQGVRAGYRVIDEYLSTARSLASGLSPTPQAPASDDARRLSERVVQHATDLAGAWLEFLRTGMQSAGAAPPAGAACPPLEPGPFTIPNRPFVPASEEPAPVPSTPSTPPTCRAPVVLDVTSARRVVSWVELLEAPLPVRCGAHALRLDSDRSQRLPTPQVDVEHTPRGPRLRVALSIPPQAWAGSYSARLLDADDNTPIGSLHVELHA